MQFNDLIDYGHKIKRLLFGAPYRSFAILLVSSGILLVAGPGVFETIILKLFNYFFVEESRSNDTIHSYIVDFLGIFLCFSGIGIYTYFYRIEQNTTEPAPDNFRFSVPDSWTFQDTATIIAERELGALIDFEGFSKNELRATLRSTELEFSTPVEALKSLGSLAKSHSIRSYVMNQENGRIKLTIKKRE